MGKFVHKKCCTYDEFHVWKYADTGFLTMHFKINCEKPGIKELHNPNWKDFSYSPIFTVKYFSFVQICPFAIICCEHGGKNVGFPFNLAKFVSFFWNDFRNWYCFDHGCIACNTDFNPF